MEFQISQDSVEINETKSNIYNVTVIIIEASNLVGTITTTQICVKLGKKKKWTRAKTSTDRPYYNEFFVFGFKGNHNALINQVLTINIYRPLFGFRKRKLIGGVRFDLSTIWIQPEHSISHKWIALTHPREPTGAVKGYLKCDIAIVPPGKTVEKPLLPKLSKKKGTKYDERELFIPESLGAGKLKAIYTVRIFKAENLFLNLTKCPKKRASKKQKKIKCFVRIYYAGLSGDTTIKKCVNECKWNEEITFTEVFPPLYNRLRIDVHFKGKKHCLRYINLKQISDPTVKGFLPTYGPVYLHLYNPIYNYLGSLLVSMETKIVANLQGKQKMVGVKRSLTKEICDNLHWNTEDFALFGFISDVSMLKKSFGRNKQLNVVLCFADNERHHTDKNNYNRIKQLRESSQANSYYNFVEYDTHIKDVLFIKKRLPDLRHRLFVSNALDYVSRTFRKGLEKSVSVFEHLPAKAFHIIDHSFQELRKNCKFVLSSEIRAYTSLQKERIKIIKGTLENIITKVNKVIAHSGIFMHKFKVGVTIYQSISKLIKDPQDNFPNMILKLKCRDKMLAYANVLIKDIMFSSNEFEKGRFCGRVSSFYLYDPKGKEIFGKIDMYLWFGLYKSIGFALKEIPPGHADLTQLTEIPRTIVYEKVAKFKCRAHIYHARLEPCEDVHGSCTTSVNVLISSKSEKSQIVRKSLCPVWKETIIVENINLCGEAHYYKLKPIPIVVEMWNHDGRQKRSLVGRIFVKPLIYVASDLETGFPTPSPSLKWYRIFDKKSQKGEILAMFELIEVQDSEMGEEHSNKLIERIPSYIQPKTTEYRLEVLFWGIRETKRLNLCKIEHPKIVVDCGESTITSQVLKSATNFPNFCEQPLFANIELPEDIMFAPPLVIRAYDARSFGTSVYVGNHVIKNVHKLKVEMIPLNKWKKVSGRKSAELAPKRETYTFFPQSSDEEGGEFTDESTPLISHLSTSKPKEYLDEIDKLYIEEKKKHKIKSALCCMNDKTNVITISQNIRYPQPVINPDENEKYFDWWTKYFESMKINNSHSKEVEDEFYFEQETIQSGKGEKIQTKKCVRNKPYHFKSSKLEIFSSELEKQPFYESFNDVLKTFEIVKPTRKKCQLDKRNVMAKFKGGICIYEADKQETYVTKNGLDWKSGYYSAMSVYSEETVLLTVRIYIIRAHNLNKKQKYQSLDTYIEIKTQSFSMSDTNEYIENDCDPIYGKCYELEARLPFDSTLTVRVMDWNRLTPHEFIGETVIDIENRYYSRHRGSCGLPEKYNVEGYNAWRDTFKPTEILDFMCRFYNISKPKYTRNHVYVGNTTFGTDQIGEDRKECLALSALRKWHKIPFIGCHLLREHIETRHLYNSSQPGMSQGMLEMWIDMFPKYEGCSIPPMVNISPRIPDDYELRVIVWSIKKKYSKLTQQFYTKKYSDLFIKAWIEGREDMQHTDVHFRAWNEGLFNWRFIFNFSHYREEEVITCTHLRKRSKSTKIKIPPVLYLQLWDNARVCPNTYLGSLSLDLHRIPEPRKNVLGTQIRNPLKSDRTFNIFNRRHLRGWWPFIQPKTLEHRDDYVTGIVDLELSLLNLEDAKRNPAGSGRSEPLGLPPPLRPHARLALILSPIRATRDYICRKHKKKIFKFIIIGSILLFFALFIYSFPSHLALKIFYP